MSGRDEIERIKREMRRSDRMVEMGKAIEAYLGTKADRATARAELEGETPDGPSVQVSIVVEEFVPEATPENVRRERQRRIDSGEPYGYDALATHFASSVGTIRRRLGLMK